MAEPGSTRDPMRGRRRLLAAVLIAALAGAGVALAAASRIESPQQAAVNARAPAPSVITATVRRKILAVTVAVTGRVTTERTMKVSGASAAPPGDSVVVTAVPVHAGEQVSAGQVLVEVDGRPVIALEGRLPAYRDLRERDSGPDVAQLQEALESLGYVIGDERGLFGAATAAAVKDLYDSLGYAVPEETVSAAAPPASPASPAAAPSPATKPGKATPSAAPSKTAAYLPAGEVAFVPRLPAQVASVQVSVGSSASGTALTLALGGSLRVRARVDAVDGQLLKRGMTAAIGVSGGVSQPVSARITRVGAMGLDASTGAYYPVTLDSVRRLPKSWAGQKVTVVIHARTTRSSVLAVPGSAIYTAADGTSEVLVYSGGRERAVPVRTGASAGGWVEVAPRGRSELSAGERVVVGSRG